MKLAHPISGNEEVHIDLLVGSDQYWKLVTGCVIKGERGPTAIHTKLGWVLSGPMEDEQSDELTTTNLVSQTHALKCSNLPARQPANEVSDDLKAFWDLESLGITLPEKSVQSEFEESISFHDGRYEVKLPWKEPRQELPDNYETSRKRLDSLLK